MNVSDIRPAVLAIAMLMIGIGMATAQTAVSAKKNNPYSPSPDGAVFTSQNENPTRAEERPTAEQSKFNDPKNSNSILTTEIYRVGVGDVLFIKLKNSPQGSRYCTVRFDGSIDFPLSGENVIVAGHTADVIEEMLTSKITLYPDPKIEVTVREYGSHKITVSGIVENPGDKNLQREAMPLCAIRSAAIVDPKATRVLVRRGPLLKPESYDLENPVTDNVLIYPGNSIEFISDKSDIGETFIIFGDIGAPGQKVLIAGMTLYRGVLASTAKGDPKKAIIRRRNDKGIFSSIEYNLRAIKDGKIIDPVLRSGDVIEIQK